MAEFETSPENPENQDTALIRMRLSYTSNDELISDYINSEDLLAQERGNPMPQTIFDDTKDATVLNLADTGHRDDDHFLSLMHPDTIDRAKQSGFKDIVLEAGDLSDMTDMYDEYVNTVAEFSAGQERVEITLGNETKSFTELEYKAHIFGVIRDLHSDSGWLDHEEASRKARATIDTLEYAASQDIRVHAIGAPMEQANSFISSWVEDYDTARSLPLEDYSAEQAKIIIDFGARGPEELLLETLQEISEENTAEFYKTLNPTELDFVNEALDLILKERTGDATINRVTANSIKNIIEERQNQGFTNPRVLHMHGALHFTEDNDIDNLLENMGITTQTIGFSGAAPFDQGMSRLFNTVGQDEEFPQKWYIAATGQYGNINMHYILEALRIADAQAQETPQEDEADVTQTTTTEITVQQNP